MRKLATLACLTTLLVSSSAFADTANDVSFHSLSDKKTYGEIRGQVQNCTNQSALEDVLLHVPGKSIATRLSKDGSFLLHWVPTGSYNLDLEINDRKIGQVNNIPVKEGRITHLDAIDVCVTAQEAAVVLPDEPKMRKSSKIRCPKGGFTCSSSWHNIKAKKSRDQETAMKTPEKKQPPVYTVSEGLQLIRVQ